MEYERMTKDVNRTAYTRKIMEIVTNIKKQKQEIDKVCIFINLTDLVLLHHPGRQDRCCLGYSLGIKQKSHVHCIMVPAAWNIIR